MEFFRTTAARGYEEKGADPHEVYALLLKERKEEFDRTTMAEAIEMPGETAHKPEVMLGYGAGGIHEPAHRTMMILKHFDPDVYGLMTDDFVACLSS